MATIVALDAYATNSSNAAASSPNSISAINDGTANEQVVVVGDGSGSTVALSSGKIPVVDATTETNTGTTATNTGTIAGAVSSSKVNVNISSGTVTTNADGSISGGTAGSKSLAVGGLYDSTPPTLTNGQQAALQLDSSGNLNVNVKADGSSGVSSTLYTNQVTVNTTQVQISSTSHALSNGIIVKAPTSNSAAIYVGLTGVTTSTGDIIEPGEARGYAVNNLNLLYIISAASSSDIISYSAN